MKVALVHDFLTRFGGAERVLLALHKMFPDAPIYALLFDEKTREYFPNAEIRPSFIQKFPKFLRNRPKFLAPFCPTAVETFDLRDFDLVISSSSAFAKGIIVRPKTTHICYCHSPARFVHDYYHDYLKDLGAFFPKWPVKILAHYLRIWDKTSADRVDYFIANSKATGQRIKKYYKTEAAVIYPSVANVWSPGLQTLKSPKENYFLIVSQLTPYKRIDIAIEAFNKMNFPLCIIGDGPDKKRLQKIAGVNVKFLGWLPEEEKWRHLENCEALIFPGEDDFGIVLVEAMACGKPVLALRAGGALETIIEGETGEFFDELSPEILAAGVKRLKENARKYDKEKIIARASEFSEERFEKEIKEFIAGVIRKL
ncbi:MAG: glycosyltransferase [Patescibacteria group bacterium]